MATLASGPIEDSRVNSDTVLPILVSAKMIITHTRLSTYIPNDDSLGCPSNTSLVVDTTADMIQQES
jgi:hypothetical protein